MKQVAQDWLSAVDTEGEDLQTRSLIAELSADVNTIDEVIPFFASAFAKQHFGEEQAAAMYAQAQKVVRSASVRPVQQALPSCV